MKVIKRNGFTLAEVLITLVVIGVIAAITIPTITANHRKEEVETRLKKFYTAMYNAHQSEIINGNSLFDVVKISGNCSGYCEPAATDIKKWLKENIIDKHLSVAKYSKRRKINGQTRDDEYCFNDGSCFWPSTTTYDEEKYACRTFLYDINGDKKPNKNGRDRFYMTFCEGATPEYIDFSQRHYGEMTAFWAILEKNSKSWHKNAIGYCKSGTAPWMGCFYLIKNNGFKIPDDYPIKI